MTTEHTTTAHAADPATVIALLDEIERLRARVDSMQMANDMLRATHRTDNQYLLDEIERLRQWKAEAMDVLSEWEKTWIAAGRPGRIGTSKAASVREEIERLRGEGEWEYGVHLGATSEVRAHTSRRLAVSDARSKSTTTYPDGRVEVFDRVLMRRRKAGPWEPVENAEEGQDA